MKDIENTLCISVPLWNHVKTQGWVLVNKTKSYKGSISHNLIRENETLVRIRYVRDLARLNFRHAPWWAVSTLHKDYSLPADDARRPLLDGRTRGVQGSFLPFDATAAQRHS